MTTTLRVDDGLKRECDAVLADIGLSFSAAVNIFMREITRSGAFPFQLRSSKCKLARPRSISSILDSIREERVANNEPELTLDEINAEIAAARQGA